jgi:hypothetical protein
MRGNRCNAGAPGGDNSGYGRLDQGARAKFGSLQALLQVVAIAISCNKDVAVIILSLCILPVSRVCTTPI